MSENTGADVCIVGAGIAGLSVAYMLARDGKSVVVLDDREPGKGMTERTTAHLSSALDDRYGRLERLHGREGARMAAESHSAAIELIEEIVAVERIDCAFERLEGYLFAPPGETSGLLDEELDAARRAGLSGVRKVERAPIGNFDTGPCLLFPDQAQFHPTRYLAGLAEAIERRGGRIYERTHVRDIEAGSALRVATGAGAAVTAGAAVVATNVPINDRLAIHTKQAPYATYVIAARVPSGSIARALYWDTADPYHYVRLSSPPPAGAGKKGRPFDLLLVGGEDHKTGQADDAAARYLRLEMWARDRFPMIERVDYAWSGQVMEPVDGLAFIGRNPADDPRVYIATGDSGHGMTHGTIAGILISDLVMGRENSWEALYDPSRKNLLAVAEYAKENLNVAGQYTAWVTAGEVDRWEDIMPDSGAIMRQGLSKLAVYRDREGAIHVLSAPCTHLGCVVAWNSEEKTWDCPCHGSRYSALGRVLNGPAREDLKALDPAGTILPSRKEEGSRPPNP